ncbi:MAG: GNAT family N-acetyltransferase [Acidimicrobiia bacterium]|nr:GNAT family N-acetyltransferase [Acidimicrobiia bacterium]
MADYPTDFEFDLLLRDGEVVQMRPIRPEDLALEQDFITRVGTQSLYFRFFKAKRELSPEELRYFTNVDYDDRMAFIVLDGDDMVAVGRYDVIPGKAARDGGRVAEVAFLVQDDHQGRGIGSRLLQHLTVYARLKGISEFEATVLAENHGMLRMFRNSGYTLHRQLDGGVYAVEFPIEYSLEAREAEWEHEKRATTASLMPILYPASIAVIGASRDADSIGGRLMENLLMRGFTGPVYPVNPSADFVHSVRAYDSVLDIPDAVDLAFIVVPARFVASVLEQCGEKGVRGVVVISAGFGETGEDGEQVERQLRAIARKNGMRLVGPNCMGVLNTDSKIVMDGQFGPYFPPAGNVAMASQSGALGLAILQQADELNIGISTFVSLGNRLDVSSNDLLLYWEGDPATDVILLYMESFGNPRRFGRLAKRISRSKPIVAVKSGRSSAGARAASSHTGALASLDHAVDALFLESGVIRTDTLDELFAVTSLLAQQPLPKGRRVAVLSNAGGPAILAADSLEAHGLVLPGLSDELQSEIMTHLLAEASAANPVDMVASAGPDQYAACLDALLASDEIDAVVVIHIPTDRGGSAAVAAAVESKIADRDQDKTLLAVYMGGLPDDSADYPVPVYNYPEAAAKALAEAATYAEWRAKPEGEYDRPADVDRVAAEKVVRNALAASDEEGVWLSDAQMQELLAAYGIPIVRSRVAETADEAVKIAAELGTAVALKIVAPSVLHKSDVGGVALNVSGENAVREAFAQVTGIADDAEGAVIQEFVGSGHEVIVGMTEDPLFGPLVVFGLGGIFVELMQDVAFRINPLSDVEAREMIAEVKAAKLLDGYRGEPAGDVDALVEVLQRVSALIDDNPEIAEMDLNPVKALEPGQGVRVVDARIRVRPVVGAVLPSRKDVPGRLA